MNALATWVVFTLRLRRLLAYAQGEPTERAAHARRNLVYDRAWGLHESEDAVPGIDLITGQPAFGHRRKLWKNPRPFTAGDGECADSSGANVRRRRQRGTDVERLQGCTMGVRLDPRRLDRILHVCLGNTADASCSPCKGNAPDESIAAPSPLHRHRRSPHVQVALGCAREDDRLHVTARDAQHRAHRFEAGLVG